jgi:ubiquinone/menaquinone biosynthesis C-methylase UbiE/peptidoglycan/xylan/chitin deacetylase (PgdA/CDA1 family)
MGIAIVMTKGENDMPFNAPLVTFFHDIEQDCDSKADFAICRDIVKEFLRIEKKYNIIATYNIVGKLCAAQPDLVQWIKESGHEVAYHSYNHQPDWQPKYYASEINLCKPLPYLAKGYRSPRSQWNKSTLGSLWDNGFLWDAEDDKHREPYFIYKGLVRLPIAGDDWTMQEGKRDPSSWCRDFSHELRVRRYCAFGSHDTVTSFAPEQRLQAWERVIQIALEKKATILTFSEAADLFRRKALEKYYGRVAGEWNRHNEHLYRTKRFRECVTEVVEKMGRPVVADIASGGGLLTNHLKDKVEKLYCIDNTENMLNHISAGGIVEVLRGEVTDTNLPDNSVDFVVCARIIEYLFWPERLADEIKRIAKGQAMFLVTFPAVRIPPLPREESPAGRIRHYFTVKEIQEWAGRIGPIQLIGVQYALEEPRSPEEEQRYREIERDPQGKTPTNWVVIGSVHNKSYWRNPRKIIPLSLCTFKMSMGGKERLMVVWEGMKKLIPIALKRLLKKLISRHKPC